MCPQALSARKHSEKGTQTGIASELRETNPIKRRTVISSAAWAAPVIAVAVATPAASASEAEPEPSDTPTSVRVTTGSSIAAGSWAQATIEAIDTSTRPSTAAIFPENTVITITAPDGVAITVDESDRAGIASIDGLGTSSVTIIPTPGVTTVGYYYTLTAAGTAITQVSGDLSGSASGVFN